MTVVQNARLGIQWLILSILCGWAEDMTRQMDEARALLSAQVWAEGDLISWDNTTKEASNVGTAGDSLQLTPRAQAIRDGLVALRMATTYQMTQTLIERLEMR